MNGRFFSRIIYRVCQSVGKYRTMATVVDMIGNDFSQVFHAEVR